MARKKNNGTHDEEYFRRQMRPKRNAIFKRDPEVAVESHLIRLEKLDKEYFSFWEDYWGFLAREREKLIDDIKEAIFSAKSGELEFKRLSRIVEGQYGHDPLCTVGSIKSTGGRFNFGQISSSIISFQCLYLAENYKTAFCEKYLYREDEVLSDGLTPTDLHFEEPGTNVHCKVNVFLDNYLDLRVEGTLENFIDVIAKIEPTEELQARAFKLKMGRLTTTKTEEKLLKNIFESNYKQWGTWFDQPSNSQWIGHYAKLAGLQAIVYPSCRSTTGYNLAIFTDNFDNSDAVVEINDQASFIDPMRKKIDSSNYHHYFKGIPAPSFTNQLGRQ